jgi:hypothetical protein
MGSVKSTSLLHDLDWPHSSSANQTFSHMVPPAGSLGANLLGPPRSPAHGLR